MATNFPTSLDALTNPTGASALTSPDHAGQHTDANDAIEAIEAQIGTTASPVLARLASPTFTGTVTAPTFSGALSGNASTVTTNANLTGHITSVGNAAVLGSFTSAQLASALTDETGTGANVFAGSPTLTGTVTAAALTVTNATTSGSYLQGTDYLSPYQGFRNKIINGDFRIWQRGTSLTGFAYTSDRWLAYNAAAVNTVSQQTASLTGFQYCARVQRNNGATNTGVNYLVQAVETSNSYPLQGKSATVSFWARKGANYSSASSLLGANLETGTGTDQNYINAWTGSVPTVGSFTLTASWQRFTVTGSVPSNATGVGVSFYYTPVGTAGAADYFEVTGVQLEEGSVATPFEHQPIGTELALCQRYYQVSNGSVGAYANAGGNPIAYLKTVVTMRATPTLTIVTAPSYTNASALTTDQLSKDGNRFYISVTTLGVGYADNFVYSLSAEL